MTILQYLFSSLKNQEYQPMNSNSSILVYAQQTDLINEYLRIENQFIPLPMFMLYEIYEKNIQNQFDFQSFVTRLQQKDSSILCSIFDENHYQIQCKDPYVCSIDSVVMNSAVRFLFGTMHWLILIKSFKHHSFHSSINCRVLSELIHWQINIILLWFSIICVLNYWSLQYSYSSVLDSSSRYSLMWKIYFISY